MSSTTRYATKTFFSLVANFIVKEPLYLSDHSPVVTWLKINNKIGSSHTIPERDILSRLPKQFLWENDSTQKFKDALRSLNIQALIREYMADDSLNENAEKSLEKVESILITTAKCCLKIKTGKTRRSIKLSSNKKWFDKECRLKRHELRKLANKEHRNLLNPIIREQYHDTLRNTRSCLFPERMNTTMPRFPR